MKASRLCQTIVAINILFLLIHRIMIGTNGIDFWSYTTSIYIATTLICNAIEKNKIEVNIHNKNDVYNENDSPRVQEHEGKEAE